MSALPIPLQPDRRTYLGGSDIAALFGVSKWRTPLQVYLEKTGRAVEDTDPERAKRLARGKRLEPVILQMVQDAGIEIVAANVRALHPEHEFMSAEVDFLWRVTEHALANIPGLADAGIALDSVQHGEIKTVHPFAAGQWGEEGTDEVPIYYAAQSMYGLGLAGRDVCLYATLVGTDDLLWYVVRRDQETVDALFDRAVRFWTDHVLADVPPDPIDEVDIKLLYPKDNGGEAVADEHVAGLVSELRQIKAALKPLEDREKELKIEIQSFMKPAATLVDADGQALATWKSNPVSRVDVKRLAAERPEIANEYRDASESRRFLLKGTKK